MSIRRIGCDANCGNVCRRLALESALAESLARLDANEARYRLLLDAHQLWQAGDDPHGVH